ncbi:MAG: ATP-binding protein [Bdellovibrionales bacterium]
MRNYESSGDGMAELVEVILRLSLARNLEDVTSVTRQAARHLTGADGATFVLREGDLCYYADEDAIGPLWKGKRFPMSSCVSGWAMLNRQTAVIEDIYQDPRIPAEAYRPTFVKSLVMVPIRVEQPIGAIGNYWAAHHKATPGQLRLLEALADSTSIALENVRLLSNLQEVNLALQNSLRMKDEFIAIAAHELRTPLAALKMQLELNERLARKQVTETLGSFRKSSELSMRQVERLIALTEQLLDVSRIQLERIELQYSRMNLSEAVTATVEKLGTQLQSAGCVVETKIDPDIHGEWDAERIDQILSHLLSNVVKHAAGKPVQITLSRNGADGAVLSIKDHGPGIPESLRKRLFQRFERGVALAHFGGLGLGLFIAKSLVEAHHGRIYLAPEAETGSRFVIELPVSVPNARIYKAI